MGQQKKKLGRRSDVNQNKQNQGKECAGLDFEYPQLYLTLEIFLFISATTIFKL